MKTLNKRGPSIDPCYILSCVTYYDFHDKGRDANKEATEPGGYGLYS